MKISKLLVLNSLIIPILSLHGGDWQNLFNDKDLTGWEVKGWAEQPGVAEFTVVDGMILGTSKLDVPNTFLCTEKTYGDFILEFEVLVDVGLNSGIQFRSHSDPAYQNGRVHGYQVEIGHGGPGLERGSVRGKNAGAGSIRFPVMKKGRKAFRNGEWNHYRVEAIGILPADVVSTASSAPIWSMI